MQIGSDVVLQQFVKGGYREFDGIVIGSQGDSLNVAYFEAEKESLLGGVDWRNAFSRIDGVKHVDHEDVKAGKEGFAYRLDEEEKVVDAPAPEKAKGK